MYEIVDVDRLYLDRAAAEHGRHDTARQATKILPHRGVEAEHHRRSDNGVVEAAAAHDVLGAQLGVRIVVRACLGEARCDRADREKPRHPSLAAAVHEDLGAFGIDVKVFVAPRLSRHGGQVNDNVNADQRRRVRRGVVERPSDALYGDLAGGVGKGLWSAPRETADAVKSGRVSSCQEVPTDETGCSGYEEGLGPHPTGHRARLAERVVEGS